MKLILCIALMSSLFANGECQDVLDVAQTIYNESQGESYRGKAAVATVIYNRAMNRRKTYQQIVKQKDQFAYSTPSVKNNIYYDQCIFLSKKLHAGTFEPLGKWNMFFNPDKCTPYWYKSMTDRILIDNHLFGNIKSSR